jgi:predicted ATPase/class 3 adenylate cyclase
MRESESGIAAPSGTVTFLFTDIEGSTSKWQADRTAMEAALAAHDQVLRDTVDSWRGRIVKHTGDGIMAVFASANDAVAAAVGAQELLGLPVRMGLHTGEAQVRDGDFFGPALNRAARIMSAGSAGQVLVSESTATLLDGVDLVDLGSHRLKDLVRLERLWQVGQGTYPPVRVVDRTPGNVSGEQSELFGRTELVAAVARRLEVDRVVSLVGVGGVGKTSLALAVAGAVQANYPDGVWFIELAPIGEPANVIPAIAGVFGQVAVGGMTVRDGLFGSLASKELLLVLDNCEHVVDEVADLVESLIGASRTVDVLVTSREGLGVTREQQITVASLPSDGADAAAIELFVARAAQLDAGFTLDESNVDDVIAICRALDGIPLAIELAATRVRTLAPREIRERLSDRFRLLSGGRRRVVERHQTLRHTVQWSYELLNPVERTLLNRLSVFAGGCTMPAVEAVCAGGIVDVVDVVDSLVAKSLVVAERRSATVTRYRLLETIRQFAEEELNRAGEANELRTRFDTYLVTTLRTLVVENNERLTGWIDDEFDNLRAAFESMLVDDLEAATSLSSLLACQSWLALRYENLAWPARVIDARHDEIAEVPAELLGASIWALVFAQDFAAARSTAERAMALARRHPPSSPKVDPWLVAASEAIMSGDGDRVLDVVAEAVAIHEPSVGLITMCRFYETWAHFFSGDLDASLAAARRYEPVLRTGAFDYLADWAFARLERDPSDALARYERVAEKASRIGAKFIVMNTEREIGHHHLVQGQPRAALEMLSPICEQWYAANDVTNWASTLCILAPTCGELGEWDAAAFLLGALEERGTYALPMAGMRASELDELAVRAKVELGDSVFAHDHEAGRSTTDKEVMDHLRSIVTRLLAAPPTQAT